MSMTSGAVAAKAAASAWRRTMQNHRKRGAGVLHLGKRLTCPAGTRPGVPLRQQQRKALSTSARRDFSTRCQHGATVGTFEHLDQLPAASAGWSLLPRGGLPGVSSKTVSLVFGWF